MHSDNGSAITSKKMVAMLKRRGVAQSLNRPRVSNDNTFMESWFKTVKYSSDFPAFFAGTDQAYR